MLHSCRLRATTRDNTIASAEGRRRRAKGTRAHTRAHLCPAGRGRLLAAAEGAAAGEQPPKPRELSPSNGRVPRRISALAPHGRQSQGATLNGIVSVPIPVDHSSPRPPPLCLLFGLSAAKGDCCHHCQLRLLPSSARRPAPLKHGSQCHLSVPDCFTQFLLSLSAPLSGSVASLWSAKNH